MLVQFEKEKKKYMGEQCALRLPLLKTHWFLSFSLYVPFAERLACNLVTAKWRYWERKPITF